VATRVPLGFPVRLACGTCLEARPSALHRHHGSVRPVSGAGARTCRWYTAETSNELFRLLTLIEAYCSRASSNVAWVCVFGKASAARCSSPLVFAFAPALFTLGVARAWRSARLDTSRTQGQLERMVPGVAHHSHCEAFLYSQSKHTRAAIMCIEHPSRPPADIGTYPMTQFRIQDAFWSGHDRWWTSCSTIGWIPMSSIHEFDRIYEPGMSHEVREGSPRDVHAAARVARAVLRAVLRAWSHPLDRVWLKVLDVSRIGSQKLRDIHTCARLRQSANIQARSAQVPSGGALPKITRLESACFLSPALFRQRTKYSWKQPRSGSTLIKHFTRLLCGMCLLLCADTCYGS